MTLLGGLEAAWKFVCELAEYDDIMRTIQYTKPETQRDDALHATVYADVLALRMADAMSN